ncbi:MAG: hypothetical protein WD200_01730 [Candidatus Andersenbacteria bacterium]
MQILPKNKHLLLATASMWVLPLMVAAAGIENPIKGTETIQAVLINFIQWLLRLVGLLALGALVWGGIRFTVSFGNEAAVKSAKQIITWAVVGLITVILSYAIVNIVKRFLSGPVAG